MRLGRYNSLHSLQLYSKYVDSSRLRPGLPPKKIPRPPSVSIEYEAVWGHTWSGSTKEVKNVLPLSENGKYLSVFQPVA